MRVILATDGSTPSQAATEFLLRLPFTPEDRFIILHILKEFVLPDTIDPNREFRKAGKAGAVKLVQDVAEKFRAAGFNATEAVREGDPAREVAEALEEFDADLAVLGHKGQTDFQRFLLGSVSHHVLRQGKRSVLIVRDAPPARSIRVLYCTDGSTHARFARDLFMQLPFPPDTEVDVLSVVDMQVTSLPEQYYPYSETSTMMAELRTHLMQMAEGYVVEDAKVLRDRFKTVHEHVTVGVPETEILTAIDEMSSDLTVMGSAGIHGLRGVLVGDVSQRVVKHARGSVLVGKIR
jgi:nucleotide-binding universal stress UspA family protein